MVSFANASGGWLRALAEPPESSRPVDASDIVLFNFTEGSRSMNYYVRVWGLMYWHWNSQPELPMVRANATYRRLLHLYGPIEWMWIAMAVLSLATMLTIAWMVRALPLRAPHFKRNDKHPLPLCCERLSRRCGRTPAPSKVALDDILNSAEKVLDSCKLVSVFFIFLTPSAIAQNLCDTPSVLLTLPGYDITTLLPSSLSGAKLDMVRYRTVLNYTTEQYHAVVALYATSPELIYFFSLYIFEVLSMVIFIGSWGAVRKERWAVFYATAALFMALYWMFYETQAYTRVTLLDSGEAFLCVIPYLSIYTRAFGILHLVISSFYYGLALGHSRLRVPCIGAPHSQDEELPMSTASVRGSSAELGEASSSSNGSRGTTVSPSVRHSVHGGQQPHCPQCQARSAAADQ